MQDLEITADMKRFAEAVYKRGVAFGRADAFESAKKIANDYAEDVIGAECERLHSVKPKLFFIGALSGGGAGALIGYVLGAVA